MDADDFGELNEDELREKAVELQEASRRLLDIVTKLETWLGGAAQVDVGGEWAQFLAEHPELRGYLFPANGKHPERWVYSHNRNDPHEDPERLLAALAAVLGRKPGGATSADVARELWGADSLPENRTRIGHIFYGLHRRGRVIRVGCEGTLRLWALPATAKRPKGGARNA